MAYDIGLPVGILQGEELTPVHCRPAVCIPSLFQTLGLQKKTMMLSRHVAK